MNREEIETRIISRAHSLDISSVKEVDPGTFHFQQYLSDDEQGRISRRRRGKMDTKEAAFEEDLSDDPSELEDLLNAGKEELLKTSVLSLNHLSNDKIVSLMRFIVDMDSDYCRPLPKVAVFATTAPAFTYWNKLISRVKTLISIRLITSPRSQFVRMITTRAGCFRGRDAAIQMSEAVAEVLEGRYLRDLQHLALPPCHISTIVRALINGHVSTLQQLELKGHSDPTPFSNTRPLRRLFMSGLLERLQHLVLSKCMEEEEMAGLAAALNSGKLTCLRHLDLSGNLFEEPTGSRSLTILMRCRALANLEHLNLKDCGISDEGMQAFTNAIMAKGPWKFKCLNLESNDIGDAGFSSLLRLVKADRIPQLLELHLLKNYRIGEETKIEFAKLLESGHVSHLEVVYLSSYLITERVAEAFLVAYKNNTGLYVELPNVLWPNELIERGVARFRERNLGLLFSPRKPMH